MNNLASLDTDHPLRNTPLNEIGAEYRNLSQKNWKPIGTIKIHRSTYNALKGTWIECNEWRCSGNSMQVKENA